MRGLFVFTVDCEYVPRASRTESSESASDVLR